MLVSLEEVRVAERFRKELDSQTDVACTAKRRSHLGAGPREFRTPRARAPSSMETCAGSRDECARGSERGSCLRRVEGER